MKLLPIIYPKGGERLSQKPYSFSARTRNQQTTIADQIKAALEQTTSLRAAAKLLDIDRATLAYHMAQNGIVVEVQQCRKIVMTQTSAVPE